MSKTMRLTASAIVALTGLAALAGTASAQGSAVKVGNLTCNVSSGFGFIFGSSKALNCTYAGVGGRYEHYTGTINKFGADIGYTSGGVLVWTVVAPVAVMQPGALAGSYAGGTASATVGVGVGANALVGGSNNTVALQPLSIEGNQGLNVAAGIASITLAAAP
jgi:Protein of unknown function (DUF992)